MAAGSHQPPDAVAQHPILKPLVWDRMHENDENFMTAFCGETGSGKSWAALRVCEILDPNFTVDQIAFSIEEFLELVADKSYPEGSMILFEEASVGASNHNWYEKANQILGQVVDTWRHQNRGAVFTLPSFGRLDPSARPRMHSYVDMVDKDVRAGYSTGKYYQIIEDSFTGNLRREFHRADNLTHKYIEFSKPSKELRVAYEERKEEFTDDLNTRLLDELRAENDSGDDGDEYTPKEVCDIIEQEDSVDDYISTAPGGDYIDRDLLQVEFGLSNAESKQTKSLLRKQFDLDVM